MGFTCEMQCAASKYALFSIRLLFFDDVRAMHCERVNMCAIVYGNAAVAVVATLVDESVQTKLKLFCLLATA